MSETGQRLRRRCSHRGWNWPCSSVFRQIRGWKRVLLGRGNDGWLHFAAIRRQELCAEGLIDRGIYGITPGAAGHGGMAASAEVIGVGQQEIGVPFGVHRPTGAGAVIRESLGGLDLVADGAMRAIRARTPVQRTHVAGHGQAGGETHLSRDRCVVTTIDRSNFDVDLCVPKSGFDGNIGDLREQRRASGQENDQSPPNQ